MTLEPKVIIATTDKLRIKKHYACSNKYSTSILDIALVTFRCHLHLQNLHLFLIENWGARYLGFIVP